MRCLPHPPYLPRASEGVHVIEDGDELPVVGRIQNVAVNFEVLHHQIHHVRPQFQGYDVRPVGLSSLQRGPATLLRLQFAPLLPGKDFTLLAKRKKENRNRKKERTNDMQRMWVEQSVYIYISTYENKAQVVSVFK